MEKKIHKVCITSICTDEGWEEVKNRIHEIIKDKAKMSDVSKEARIFRTVNTFFGEGQLWGLNKDNCFQVYKALEKIMSTTELMCHDECRKRDEFWEQRETEENKYRMKSPYPFALVLLSMDEKETKDFPLEKLKNEIDDLSWMKVTHQWTDSVTHVVVPLDKDGKGSLLNPYIYLGLAAKLFVVAPSWIKHCTLTKTRVREDRFEIRGIVEKPISFHLGLSLRTRYRNILTNAVVGIVVPLQLGISDNLFRIILQYCGALVIQVCLETLAEDKVFDYNLIIANKKSKEGIRKIVEKKTEEKKRIWDCETVVPEWLFESILQGRNIGFKPFRLFKESFES